MIFDPDPIDTQFEVQSDITFGSIPFDPDRPFCVTNRLGANALGGGLDLFIVSTQKVICWNQSNNGNTWLGWNTTAIPSAIYNGPGTVTAVASGVSATTYTSERTLLVVRGEDGNIHRGSIFASGGRGRTFRGWNFNPNLGRNIPPLGRPSEQVLVGTPTVIGLPPNSYRVYTRTASDELWSITVHNEVVDTWERVSDGTNPISTTTDPEGVDVDFTDGFGSSDYTINQAINVQREGLNVSYTFNNNDNENQAALLHFSTRSIPNSPPPSNLGPINNVEYFPEGITNYAAGTAYYHDILTGTNVPPAYHELHTFVHGIDHKLYGRYLRLTPWGSVSNPSGAFWYNFGDDLRIYGKPDVVTWKRLDF